MNVDGDLDAVFANGQNNRVCLGNGLGGFTCSDVSTDTNASSNVAVGDVNRDGDPDAVFANGGQRNRVCLGDGSGGFTCSDVSTDTNDSHGVALTPSGVERLAGSNRFGTAAEISASKFDPGVPAVYVATGGNFPDALAGGPVAALNGGPILLLSSIPGETAAELTRLNPAKIVILGGTGVVSAIDATALAGFTTGAVERLAGADRFATAAAISASEFSAGVSVAYVATGANFPDALAGGPVAALNGGPILLVTASTIPAATAAELTRLNPAKIVILGGTAVVSGAVQTQLAGFTTGAVERLAGANRFSTAAAISASRFSPGVDVAYVAIGENFPDALAGGPVAGLNQGPILLVTKHTIPGPTATELDRLNPKSIVILGGVGVVSSAVETQLAAFVG
jgi:putative cell wall-binding protein